MTRFIAKQQVIPDWFCACFGTKSQQTHAFGIVKFDIYATEPPDLAESVASSAAGAAGGLLGGLIYVAIKDAQNEKDYSIEAEAVRFYEESLETLVARLR